MKHGHTGEGWQSRTYVSWNAMKQRCLTRNENVRSRQRVYIDKGIQVCERWMTFTNFLEDMGERPPGTSLDRINSDRGYEPGNCRWATPAEQAANTSRTRRLTFEGRTQPAKWWAKELGIPYTTVLARINAGWPIDKILSKRKYFENQFTNPRKSNHVSSLHRSEQQS